MKINTESIRRAYTQVKRPGWPDTFDSAIADKDNNRRLLVVNDMFRHAIVKPESPQKFVHLLIAATSLMKKLPGIFFTIPLEELSNTWRDIMRSSDMTADLAVLAYNTMSYIGGRIAGVPPYIARDDFLGPFDEWIDNMVATDRDMHEGGVGVAFIANSVEFTSESDRSKAVRMILEVAHKTLKRPVFLYTLVRVNPLVSTLLLESGVTTVHITGDDMTSLGAMADRLREQVRHDNVGAAIFLSSYGEMLYAAYSRVAKRQVQTMFFGDGLTSNVGVFDATLAIPPDIDRDSCAEALKNIAYKLT